MNVCCGRRRVLERLGRPVERRRELGRRVAATRSPAASIRPLTYASTPKPEDRHDEPDDPVDDQPAAQTSEPATQAGRRDVPRRGASGRLAAAHPVEGRTVASRRRSRFPLHHIADRGRHASGRPAPARTAYSTNAAGGSTSRSGKTRPSACGQYVPQWMGTAARGRMRRSAWAARSGSRCRPRPSVGPQPQTGMSAMSIGSPSCAHPVEQVRVAGEVDRSDCRATTYPSGGAVGPSGGRKPEWTAGTARTTTLPTSTVSPTAISRTSVNPAAAHPGAGTRPGRRSRCPARGRATTARRGGPSAGAR